MVSSALGKNLPKKASPRWPEPIPVPMYPNVPMVAVEEARNGIASEDKAGMYPEYDILAGKVSVRAKATETTMIHSHRYPLSALAVSNMWQQLALSRYVEVLHLSITGWEPVQRHSSWSITLQGSSAHSGRLLYP